MMLMLIINSAAENEGVDHYQFWQVIIERILPGVENIHLHAA